MTRDRQSESEQRDTTMARLVAAALESQTARPTGDACPESGLLAAYADHTLDADETARCESHFADCLRCQEVLAVLTVSAENPSTQREIARLSQSAGKTAATNNSAAQALQTKTPIARPQILRPVEHRAPWRWLVPAFGVAAAVALWFALRPASPNIAPGSQLMAQKTLVPPPPGQQDLIAQGSVPPQPAIPSPATPPENSATPALKRETEARNLNREPFSSATNAPVKEPAKEKDASRDEASSSSAPRPDKKIASSAQAPEAARTAPAAPPAPRQQTQAATVTVASPTITTGNAGATGGVAARRRPPQRCRRKPPGEAPAPRPIPSSGSQLSAQNAVKALPLASRNAAMAKVAAAPIVFGAPGRGVEWRIGSAGSIERSTPINAIPGSRNRAASPPTCSQAPPSPTRSPGSSAGLK